MPRQKGLLKLEGQFEDFIFYRTKYGSLMRRKGSVDKERVATDPKFARSRENSKDFGYASRLGKLIRRGIEQSVPGAQTGTTNSRLNKRLRELVEGDTIHQRGKRVLTAETAPRLAPFEWREDVHVTGMLQVVPKVDIDADGGRVSLNSDAFIPLEYFRMPEWTTHAQIILAVARVDYEKDMFYSSKAVSELLPVKSRESVALSLDCAIPQGGGSVIVAGVGVQAYMEVNGLMSRLEEGVGFVVGGCLNQDLED